MFKIKSENWNFETEKKYTFSITVLGPRNRPVLLTDNIRIQVYDIFGCVVICGNNSKISKHIETFDELYQTLRFCYQISRLSPYTYNWSINCTYNYTYNCNYAYNWLINQLILSAQ